ncbi:BrnT family toxin [Chelativorans alearense]|uniref:BrnT family toxin n=1 Tax=Chelativorans alearense TaxID=2681495 RepID=UPI0013D68DA7|nr:BrnT family toxin [Chelativorans alearense]
MEIAFDPEKDEKNRRERGLSLAVGREVIRNQVATFLDDRREYGEDRYVSYGYVGDRLHVCAFTIRDAVFRIISVRKANDREVRKHGR